MSSERRHAFISHHFKDDGLVDKFVTLLGAKGWDVRNSSVRAKPANKERIERGLVKDETLRRLLRMKISWASTVVVLIGSETHNRPWVNWEIEQAHAQGKMIVGVFEFAGKEVALPPSLEKYASALVGWNSESIQRAIDGGENIFQNQDGSARAAVGTRTTSQC